MGLLSVLSPTLFSNFMSLPGVAVLWGLLRTDPFSDFARANLITQLAVFIPTVQIPVLLTRRLAYVDLAWPSGLLAMGCVSLARTIHGAPDLKSPDTIRSVLMALAYIFQGGRMALGAWALFFSGHMRKEMQRYTYQRKRWAAAGIAPGSFAETVELQKEAFTQCLANLGPLSVPLALQSCVGGVGAPRAIEVFSWLLWGSSFVLESVADVQKLAFAQEMKKKGLRKQVCNKGLWNYTRHPNYFGEWMVWVALALGSSPSFGTFLANSESVAFNACALFGLCSGPLAMYVCLVHWTGATPAEFFSMENRPDYARYCEKVNCFFPGPRKE